MNTVIFDLDGTLINSLPSIRNSLNRTMERFGYAPVSLERTRELVGNSSRYLVEHALRDQKEDVSREEILSVLDAYNTDYLLNPIFGTYVYAGILDLQNDLKNQGVKIGVFSNKPESIVYAVLDHFFGQSYFDVVRGFREDTPRKPDPAGLLKMAKELGIRSGEILYVGDSEVDAEVGERGEVETILVSYGFRSKQILEPLRYAHLCDHVSDLKAVLEEEIAVTKRGKGVSNNI